VDAATDAVQIQAIVLAPVQITQTRVMNFGSITETAIGTIAVDIADANTETGGVTSIGGTIQAGGYTLQASTGAVVNVTAPAKATITHTTAPANTMTVDSFTFDDAGASPYTHTMAGSSDTGLRLGGTLNVASPQVPGTYTGTVTLTAVY